MPETLYDPEQTLIPDTREEGRFLSPTGLRQMLKAALAGTAFSKEFPVVDGKAEEMAFHSDVRKRGTEALNAFGEEIEDEHCARLMRVAFSIGAVIGFHEDDMYGFVGPGTLFFEVATQRDLTLLFRVLAHEDQKSLHGAYEMLGFPRETWLPMTCGAQAVARFAEAAQSRGRLVYLPTQKEDARNGIDVLVRLGNKTGICVQVKRDRESEGIWLSHITREPRGGGGRQDHNLMRRTWLGVQDFNHRYKVNWTAAVAKVGATRGRDNLHLTFDTLRAA